MAEIIIPALIGAAGTIIGGAVNKPKPIKFPKPAKAARTPVQSSDTAAREKSRTGRRGGAVSGVKVGALGSSGAARPTLGSA